MLAFELGYYTMFFLWIKFQEKKKKPLNTKTTVKILYISLIQANKIWIWLIRNKVVLEDFVGLLHDTAVKYLVPNLWIRDCETLLL